MVIGGMNLFLVYQTYQKFVVGKYWLTIIIIVVVVVLYILFIHINTIYKYWII